MKRTVIFGPPGCGKTHELADITERFLKAREGRVLFTSHTKAAAQTATERIGSNPRVDTQTLHSFCSRNSEPPAPRPWTTLKSRNCSRSSG